MSDTPKTDEAETANKFPGSTEYALTVELTVALANWNGALERALKAEADLAALAQCHDDNCRAVVRLDAELAKERARLDWLESPSGMDWQWEPTRLTVSRAAIDAAMKEDAK